jgi:serine/threonine protein phosphatase PrpC
VTKIESCGATDIGRRRQLNEDSFLVDDDTGLYVVADGMGGHNGGEIASRLAVETVSAFIQRSRDSEKLTWPFGIEPTLSYSSNRLRTAVLLANRRIWREADSSEEYTGMGTTIVAALAEDGHLCICSAGDCRAYRVHPGHIEQLTTDHSWVQAAYEAGVLRAEALHSHPLRSIVTRAVGASESLEVDVLEQQVVLGDSFLLCSDGLHGMVADGAMLDIIRGTDARLDETVRRLISAANEAGGRDNITALMVRYGPG